MSSKENILKLLEINKGKILSGNDIAQSLNISRTAVWKSINNLKEEGYEISSVNKKGYCLESKNDILSSQSIKPYINNTNLYKDIKVYKTIGSTNTEAKALANDSAFNGTVIISEQQTQGKGRLGRQFYSPIASGIYMSVIFRLENPLEQSILITSSAAVAVCRAIKKVCNLDCQIKWVNDIYIDSKKVCGILTEASVNFESRQLDYIVVGIGINVTTDSFPKELSDIATSLQEKLNGNIIQRSELIGEILNELEIVLNDLDDKNFMKEYKSRSFILGSEINVISPNSTQKATAIDFNEYGHLIVRLEDGKLKTLSSGEISVRKIK